MTVTQPMAPSPEREVAGWRIVNVHMSVAVPDDQCVMLQRRWKYGIPAQS